MTEAEDAPARSQYQPVFTQGSTLRHVLVMTASSSVGLVAVFVVDLLSLLYVSRLGDPALTAGVGFASQVLFIAIGFNIALSIGITAIVSRALGAGRRPQAQRLAASGMTHVVLAGLLVSAPLFLFRDRILDLLGARDAAHAVASSFLATVLPANFLMASGMSLQGLLRAAGDARRAMYVTLIGAVVTAMLDPLLIFGFGLGVRGAAIAVVISRIVFVSVGLWGAVHVHGLIGRPQRRAIIEDFRPMMAIAAPAILTNLATPVGNTYAWSVFARYGEQTVAALAIIDRLTPVAFGVLFALTGAVGPIIGQNYGARNFDRIRRAMLDCFGVATVYVFVVWIVMWFAQNQIADIFQARGATRDLVLFYCEIGSATWLFLAFLFVANAAYNNLGYAMFATLFNWGRATLGTIPFVTLGASMWGAKGAFVGVIAGAGLFGTGAAIACFMLLGRLARRKAQPA